MNRRRSQNLFVVCLVASVLLVGSRASAEAIVLSGEDSQLVDSVAAELRSAGFEVLVAPAETATGGRTVVSVHRVGESISILTIDNTDSVHVQSERATVKTSRAGAGMDASGATALRVAEAVRLLLARSSAHRGPTPHERLPEPLRGSASPPRGSASPPRISASPPRNPTFEAGSAASTNLEVGVLGLSLFGGSGYVAPSPAVAFGFAARGHASQHLDVAAIVMGTVGVGQALRKQHARHNYTAKTALVASWNMLGPEHGWVPSIGTGIVVDYRWWRNNVHNERADDDQQGSRGAFGVALTAGISFAHPLRFRFDVYGDVDLVNWKDVGDGHGEMAPLFVPSVLGVVGFEYDIVSRSAAPTGTNAAKR